MKQRKLNYRFHNPNSAEDTADFLCKLLIAANAGKVERAIEEAASRCAEESEYIAEPEKMKVDAPEEETVNIRRRRARQRCLAFCIFYGFCVKIHRNEKKTHLDVDFCEKQHIIESRKEGEVAIMLIQFNFKNFKSFREEATLDLSAAKMTEFSDRVVTIGSEKILPVAAIYGANASGKSNIYNAFEYMSDYVAESFRYGGEEEKFEQFRPTPFLFDSTSADAESSFEVYFTLPGDKAEKTYNYGFCINKEGVTEEWLNVKAKTARKYNTVFYRGISDEELDLSGFPKSSRDNIQVALEKQVLIISLGAKLKIVKCKDIRDWFLANEFADFGDPVTNFFLSRRLPKGFVEDKNVQQKVVEYFASFDEHIRDFRVEKVPGDGDSKDESFKINALHKKIDSDEMAEIPLSLESAGTLKMFALYPELQEVLEKGSVFFIDELNARLHPLLVRNFLLTFLNPEINKNHAQLIFTTHDTWQLSNQLLRRDEIWFVEKDERGVSSLYSLADFVDEDGVRIRKDESYEKNYMVGKYGAIPMLKALDIFKDALVQVPEGTGLSPQKKED